MPLHSRAVSPRAMPLGKDDDLPPLFDAVCDRDIPNRALGAWTPMGGVQHLRRALTPTERTQLERRLFALECALLPFDGDQVDDVDKSLHLILGYFRTVRARANEAQEEVEVLRYCVREHPAWAIEDAADLIGRGKAGFSQNYAPHNPAIAIFIGTLTANYRKRRDAIKVLLDAPVETPQDAEAERLRRDVDRRREAEREDVERCRFELEARAHYGSPPA